MVKAYLDLSSNPPTIKRISTPPINSRFDLLAQPSVRSEQVMIKIEV